MAFGFIGKAIGGVVKVASGAVSGAVRAVAGGGSSQPVEVRINQPASTAPASSPSSSAADRLIESLQREISNLRGTVDSVIGPSRAAPPTAPPAAGLSTNALWIGGGIFALGLVLFAVMLGRR